MGRQGFLLGAHKCELAGPWLLLWRLICVSMFGDDEFCLGWAWLLRPMEGVSAFLIVDDITKIRI